MESSIKVHDTGISSALAKIARQGKNMEGALKVIGERILRHTDERFTAQKGPDGKHWAPVKPATRRHKKNPNILTESHHLRDSIRYQANGNVLRVGTNKVYGAIHQFGGEIKKNERSETFTRNRESSGRFSKGTKAGQGFTFKAHGVTITARPYVGISRENSRDIVEVLTDWIGVK